MAILALNGILFSPVKKINEKVLFFQNGNHHTIQIVFKIERRLLRNERTKIMTVFLSLGKTMLTTK